MSTDQSKYRAKYLPRLLSVTAGLVLSLGMVQGAVAAPTIGVDPTSLTFAGQDVGTTSAAQTITISNVGNGNLDITSAAITGADAGDFAFTPDPFTASNLGAGASVTLDVTFTPSATGLRTATLTINSTDTTTPAFDVQLTGTGGIPNISAAPDPVTFATAQLVGTTSTAETITITNSGTGPLTISDLQITGVDTGDFAFTPVGLPIIVTESGGTATVDVTFTPTAAGARAANLSITSNDPDTNPLEVSLTGTGVAPVITLSKNTLAFATQRITTTSGALTVDITNTGDADLIISAIALSGTGAGDFAFTSDALPITVAPTTGTTTVSVTFTPLAALDSIASLDITSNDPANATTNVALTGTGTTPVIDVTATTLTFADQEVGTTSTAQTLTINNLGNEDLIISAIALSGANAGDFAFTPTTPPDITVAPGGFTTVDVTFTPSATGARAASLDITSNDPANATTNVALTGNGFTPPDINVNPLTLSFGTSKVGTTTAAQTVTIENLGTADLTITNITLSGANAGDFAIATALTFPLTVAGGTQTTVDVTFTPTAAGARTASLDIASNDADEATVSVALDGTGSVPEIDVNPLTLPFGNQLVGLATAPQTVSITNLGNADLDISDITITGGDAADFTFVTPPVVPVTLLPGATLDVEIVFTPSALGARTSALVITSDDADESTVTVPLDGTGVQPDIFVDQTAINFADQRVGVTSAIRTITVQNVGTSDLLVTDIVLAGANAADFVITADAVPFTVAPGNSVTIDVEFLPSALGARSATLTISSDDPDEASVIVTLDGNGVEPDINVDPVTLDFGQVLIGTTTGAQTFAIQNTGTSDLTVTSVALSAGDVGDFALPTPPALPLTISAGASASVDVTFTPTAAGPRSATLAVTSDDPDEPTVNVTVSGTGMNAPAMTVSVATVSFGGQRVQTTSAPQTVTISNEADPYRFPLNVNVALTGGDATDFAITSATTAAIDPGQSFDVTLTFTPSAIGARTTTLAITGDDPNATTVNVPVDGLGERPVIAVDTPAIDFGVIPTGQSSNPVTVTVSNTGNIDLIVSTVALDNANDFTFSGNTGTTVPAGQSETWDVYCTPKTLGALSATLSIASDDLDTPVVDIPLTCEGIDSPIAIDPAAVFPDTYVNDTATPLVVNVINQSDLSIDVTAITVTVNRFTVTANLPFTLANLGDSQPITLGFSPVANTNYAGNIVVTTNVGAFNFPIAGRGVQAIMAIDPYPAPGQPHDFGNIKVYASANAQVFTISNTGTYPFSVYGVTVDNTADFTVVPPQSTVLLPPGNTTTFSVDAHPMTAGQRNGTVTIQTDIRESMTATFAVRVTGTTPQITLSDNVLDFGSVDVQGTLPVTRNLTLTNSGNHPLTIQSMNLVGDLVAYSLRATPNFPAVVAPGNGLSLTVDYRPLVESDSDTATITVVSDAITAPVAQVMITGRGIDRHIDVSALSVSFGQAYRNPETPSQETLTIRNTGDALLRISAIMTGGAGAEAFSLPDATLMEVAPQGSADLTVEFAPPAVNADYQGTITIVNDDSDTPMVEISLAGAGVLPNVAVAPGNIIAVKTGVGVPVRLSELADTNRLQLVNMDPSDSFTVREVRITDTGGNPTTAPFRLVGFAPDTELAASQTLDLDVEFTPEQVGTFSVQVEIYLDVDPLPVALATIQGEAYDLDLRGGGCNSAGGGRTGAAMLLLILAALVLASRKKRKAALVLAAVLAPASFAGHGTARADSARNLDLATFRPAPGVESGMLSVESAEVGDAGAWALGLALEHAVNPLTVRIPSEAMTETPIASRTATELMFSYAFLRRFEVGVWLPFLQQSGDEPQFSGIAPPSGTAIGDLALHGKALLTNGSALRVATSATLTLPTANDGQFAGTNGPSMHARGIASMTVSRFNVAVNAGMWLRGSNRLADAEQGNALTYGLATELRLQKAVSLVGELFGARALAGDEPAAVSPLEMAVGLRYRPSRQISVGSGVGRGLAPGIGAPDLRAFLLVSYSPRARELTRVGPPPREIDRADNDGDGVINEYDKCPDQAEDKDTFDDSDGCPDDDNDNDGVPDASDECPDRAEDKDGFADEDGCPDKDNDGDGIEDKNDKCPDVPEDMDGYLDVDGCDDPDNDKDGIPDIIDQCPLEAETINGNKDEDGCPDPGDALFMVMADRIEVFEPIQFRGSSARLGKKSEGVLGQVAATLRAQTEIVRIRIAAHVHPGGGDDQELSEKRAKAVKEWLVQWGIEPERLEVKGYGSDQPLVPASQRGAKEINDRIEFIILEKRIER